VLGRWNERTGRGSRFGAVLLGLTFCRLAAAELLLMIIMMVQQANQRGECDDEFAKAKTTTRIRKPMMRERIASFMPVHTLLLGSVWDIWSSSKDTGTTDL
jgi:hypothetical protein